MSVSTEFSTGFGCEPNSNRGSASSSANGVALGSSSSSAGRINRSPSKKHSLYITLAPPLTDYDTENSSQSDYDSSHNRETDICLDSDDCSDTASTVDDGLAAEVIEFDVVSASSDNGEYLYLEDSSSGTEEYIVDQKIIVLQEERPHSPLSGGRQKRPRFSSSCSSNSELADTEDSGEKDGPCDLGDPELKPADYWKCVKCRNSQNNPLYRYCEKCYQLRKNYFPPRPRRSKSRPSRKEPRRARTHHHAHEDTSSDCKSSDDDATATRQRQHASRSPAKLWPRRSSLVGNAEAVVVKPGAAGVERAIGEGGAAGQSVELRSGAGDSGKHSLKGCLISGSSNSSINVRKRNPSQSEEDAESGPQEAKKQKIHDEMDSAEIVINGGESDPALRPKNLTLQNVIDSGFSSYSSGHESIPSPTENVDGSSQLPPSQASNLLSFGGHESGLLGVTSSQLTFSLARDLHTSDKASYSDSEVYRQSSTKCVVNKGEANAIIKRVQEGLLYTETADLMGQLAKAKNLEVKYAEQKEEDRLNNLCIICVNGPKDSAFVHSRTLHICCCYKCAIKVWNKKRRCPICNCKVKNVLKCYVH